MLNDFMPDQTSSGENVLKETSPAYMTGEADIDISLLEDSLQLTPWQRLIENDRALALVRMLEQAKIREHGTT
jgi:hypothetical protein